VAGLVFLVIGVGEEHRGKPVEADHAIGLGIVDRLRKILAPQRWRRVVLHRDWQADLEQ
jgi:hypothetical protein